MGDILTKGDLSGLKKSMRRDAISDPSTPYGIHLQKAPVTFRDWYLSGLKGIAVQLLLKMTLPAR